MYPSLQFQNVLKQLTIEYFATAFYEIIKRKQYYFANRMNRIQ